MRNFFVDSHCHLNLLDYEKHKTDINKIIENAVNSDVRYMLAVATSLSGYKEMRRLVGTSPHVAYSCGVHPCYVNESPYEFDEFLALASEDNVIALGETGLDYYHETESMVLQQRRFVEHIAIGAELQKPIIVHTRQARADTLALLKSEDVTRCGGVLHCFTEDIPTAKAVLDMGMYVSFSGIVTFKNAKDLQDVAKYVPLDRMLIETDSPYLAPVPYRGKENQPAYVKEVASFLATLKQCDLHTLAHQTTKNFCDFAHLDYDKLLSSIENK
ncbi:YchF/TatD family DNA exonuclease [Thorsellia kenyensis]|uniref:YchF/TatD family DNA exonuclease n=1 Tax=Thorsellia kenyensis TaxID=1549888 RepID=A0ABV6C8P0_9GAMM